MRKILVISMVTLGVLALSLFGHTAVPNKGTISTPSHKTLLAENKPKTDNILNPASSDDDVLNVEGQEKNLETQAKGAKINSQKIDSSNPEAVKLGQLTNFEDLRLGFSVQLPSNWVKPNYLIGDTSNSIVVYFKASLKPSPVVGDIKTSGLLFKVIKNPSDADLQDMIVLKEIESETATFKFVTPLKDNYSEKDADYGAFVKFKSQLPEIAETMKALVF